MSIRRMKLSGSWYPGTSGGIKDELSKWVDSDISDREYYSAVVPHAGWFFSGKTAAQAVCPVCRNKELIIIIGGHLPPGGPVMAIFEENIEIPGGKVKNKVEFLKKLCDSVRIEKDIYQDNTVEVVLPMAAFFNPNAEFLCLRTPADEKSINLAEELFNLVNDEGISTAVIGSTDLTHYGPDYYFTEEGQAEEALRWVKEQNDAGIIREMVNMKPEAVLKHAANNRSACSPGAAAAAVRYGALCGVEKGVLIDYSSSYDIRPAESFVGYAGIIF